MRQLQQRSGWFCDGWAWRTSDAPNDHKHDQESFHRESSQDFNFRLAGGWRSGRRRILIPEQGSASRVARLCEKEQILPVPSATDLDSS